MNVRYNEINIIFLYKYFMPSNVLINKIKKKIQPKKFTEQTIIS